MLQILSKEIHNTKVKNEKNLDLKLTFIMIVKSISMQISKIGFVEYQDFKNWNNWISKI